MGDHCAQAAIRLSGTEPSMSSRALSNFPGIDGGSLPPRNIAHVGQMMRDALVAIDARLLARKKEPLMGLNRTGALARNVHRLGAMAIATFKRIVRLHARPFMLGEFEAMAEKLLTRIDCAENLSPHLLRGLHFARNLVGPFVRYMAIGAARAHARSIVIVHGCFQLFEDIGAPFMTGGAEGLSIRYLNTRIVRHPE